MTPGRQPILSESQKRLAIWTALLGYLILAGGTPVGESNGWIRALNGSIAAVLIIRWVAAVPADHDTTDRLMLWALLAFLAACLVSDFPRQSFDAAIQATALVAGFYFARRALAGQVRAGIETAAAWLCVGLSVTFCLAWGRGWLDWLGASGGSLPPLSLPLIIWPLAHRHDVALLVIFLAPAMWSPAFRRRRAMAIIGTALAATIVLLDSSRNAELAVLGASVVVVLGYRIRVGSRGLWIAAGLTAATAVTTAAIVLASPVLLSRVANIGNILSRVTLWTEAASLWLKHPLTGIGPGGFPFSYMLTDHFSSSLFDPRHPDNALIQLLVEGGLVGLIGAVIVVAALIWGARTRFQGEPRAVWALLVFGFATLGANPTDFVFLLVPALVWAAILVPKSGAIGPTREAPGLVRRRTAIRIPVLLAAAVAAAAVSATGAASISYQLGRNAYLHGDRITAESALDAAAALDPSLSIYTRERASLAFASGQWKRAAAGYRHALELSPFDPVAWRGLALALLADSDVRGAETAANKAVDLMYVLPENQLVLAATLDKDSEAFRSAVRIALHVAPELAIPSWNGTILASADQVAAVRQAVDADPTGRATDVAFGQVLLALITGRADIAATAATRSSPLLKQSAAALAATAACDSTTASRLLDAASKVEGEQGGFWIARALVAAAAPGFDGSPATSLQFLRLNDGPGPQVVSALAGNLGDRWRYRRISLGVIAVGASIPSGQAGLWTLMTDPAAATSRYGIGWPPNCAPELTKHR